MIEKALEFVLGIITKNEIVKKFPEEFINSSLSWIRSWFLIDDLESKTSFSESNDTKNKEKIIQSKLEILLKDEKFVSELSNILNHASNFEKGSKNIANEIKVVTKGDITIGDKLIKTDGNYSDKNVAKGSTFESKEGGFRLGDDFE